MADYPRGFELEPIKEWPGELTTRRVVAGFRSPSHIDELTKRMVPARPTPLSTTMSELQTEMSKIKGTNPVLQIAVTRDQIRLDGRLRAGEKPWHPGVILTFDTPKGVMRYPSDNYTRWEDNLRAIVLTLGALRSIDRWKVAHGQQYGGFLAIESGIALGERQIVITSGAEARKILLDAAGELSEALTAPQLVRRALRMSHPDTAPGAVDSDAYRRVLAAEKYMRDSGAL